MGVSGLLPVLRSVTDQVHVSKYAGRTVGVDAMGWLYKGATRAEWKAKAKKLIQEQDGEEDGRAVFAACMRAVSVTNEMVMKLIAVLRRMDITFYVAPYEADAQLAFLSRQKIVDVVISDDSDCVPYGVKTVLLKLTPDGWGSELKRRSLGANEELSFVGWTEEMVSR
ncbi:unnamed protein product [Phytophthora lilii]|uniref:Exonuclease 1 n=1 Tax=Phytophthora lilii TaxID=2077276 RepID=A0A9W7DDD5_9STRA|nr:unnamed protein product [Phytophthora lilii]